MLKCFYECTHEFDTGACGEQVDQGVATAGDAADRLDALAVPAQAMERHDGEGSRGDHRSGD